MTQAGFTSADNELKQLKSVDRPSVIKAIAEAREHGDLSENAEYHSARELQSHIEGRIKELEAIISLAQIIEERTLQIVGEHEANIENNQINMNSPIARALIGKEEGDSVEVKTPGGIKSYEILSIKFI